MNNKETSFYTTCKTRAGWIGFVDSESGLSRTTLPQKTEEACLEELGPSLVDAIHSVSRFRTLSEKFIAYFEGENVDFLVRLDFKSAPQFSRLVWEATRSIPYGSTRSYGWVARQIGKPQAFRAVGHALGKNPLPIIIPCHRVLGSDGTLTGFGGGLEMKRYLLDLEISK